MQGMNATTGRALGGLAHLRQSIATILTTPIGSRAMRRDFGCKLFERTDSPLNGELIAEIYADVVDALFKYEPRFEVSKVSVISINGGHIILDLEGIYKPTGENVILENLEIA